MDWISFCLVFMVAPWWSMAAGGDFLGDVVILVGLDSVKLGLGRGGGVLVLGLSHSKA